MSPEGFQVTSCSMIGFYLYFGCLLVKTNPSIRTVVKHGDYHDKNQHCSQGRPSFGQGPWISTNICTFKVKKAKPIGCKRNCYVYAKYAKKALGTILFDLNLCNGAMWTEFCVPKFVFSSDLRFW